MSQVRTLSTLLDLAWDQHAERTALSTTQGDYTYRELDRRSREFANALRYSGVAPGDAVIAFTGNSFSAILLCIAATRLGAAEVALNPSESPAILKCALDDLRPRLILCKPDDRKRVEELAHGSGTRICVPDDLSRAAPALDLPSVSAHQIALIQYTSGSTGRPKAIRHEQGAIGDVLGRAPYIPSMVGHRLLLGIPIDHAHGKTCLLEYLIAGATICLRDGFAIPRQVSRWLDETKATVIEGPPTLFEMACKDADFGAKALESVVSLRMNSAKPRIELLHELRRRFPSSEIVVRYGITEIAGPICRLVWTSEEDVPLDSCGLPVPFVDVEVVSESDSDASVGNIGEVVVNSPGLSATHHRIGADSTARNDPAPYPTGDLGYLDEGGYLFLVGRKSRMIKSSGHRIAPLEIENVIASASSVDACAIAGVHDPYRGERIVAWVVLRADTTEEMARPEIEALCRKELHPNKQPHQMEFKTQLPLTASGKIDIRRLVDEVAPADSKA